MLRVPATQAPGLLTITCGAGAAGMTYQIGEVIVAHATSHQTYRNTAPITVVPSTVLTDQPFAADVAGAESSAAPGAITVLVSSLVGVTCTNPASFVGSDKETTPHLVTRALSKLGSFSPNGPKDAYNYVATSPELSATSVPITRTRTVLDEVTGDLTVYLATAAGAPDGADVTIVQTAIDEKAEPWGANAIAAAGTEMVQDVTYQSWVRGSNLTVAQIEVLQAAALALYFSTLEFGGDIIPPDDGSLYKETIEQVIGSAVAGTVRVLASLPSAAVPMTPDQVAVLGTVTPTTTLL